MRDDKKQRGERGFRGDSGPRGDEGISGLQGEKGIQGKQGEPGKYEALHVWRWRALMAWIVIFTGVTIFVLSKSNHAVSQSQTAASQANQISKENTELIKELAVAKANVQSLQRTNCGLEIFLLTARKARYESTLHEVGPKKDLDRQAVNSYKVLAKKFHTSICHIPKRLILPIDKDKNAS